MTRGVLVVTGTTGYRDQLDRTRRFLDRMKISNQCGTEFQDMAWAFFQNCWHIKDWLDNDPLATDQQKKAAIGMAHQSQTLRICQDLCNGTKHLELDSAHSGSGASHHHIAYKMHLMPPGAPEDIPNEIDCMIDDGYGNQISGKKLAEKCI